MRKLWLLMLLPLLLAQAARGDEKPLAPKAVVENANLPAQVAEPSPIAPPADVVDYGQWNLQIATFGGQQFWTDLTICQNYRIQKNVMTGHCRLLDPRDVRQAWGTLGQCEAKLADIKREKGLQSPRGKVVIAMHGLLRSRDQLEGLCRYLEKEGGYTAINFGYASSRAEVGEHAAALAKVVQQCDQAEEISFVAHSLGNIVLRHYLADCTAGGRPLDPRFKRIVMLGPPNNGAELALRFRNNPLFQLVWGRSGKQLADQWESLQPHLATPQCEFGIVAGARGNAVGLNPLVTGDDDMVVSVAETKLPGACDFMTVPVLHGDLMDDAAVRKCTLTFLRDGYFQTAEKRQPIPTTTARREQP